MFLGIDGKYSAFEELMYYFHINFMVYYILVFIVFINCIKAIVNFIFLNKRKVSKDITGIADLLVSVLSGIGLGSGMFFQGVMGDISPKYSHIWTPKLFVLCVIGLVLFIIQLIFTLRIKSNENNY